MRAQKIDFFARSDEREKELLFLKSRYMTRDQVGYDRQKSFDDALEKLNLFDFSEYGPAPDVFMSTLRNAGHAIKGFELEKT